MSFPPRFAILLDGAFVLKKLEQSLGNFPSADDVVGLCDRIKGDDRLRDLELLRIYYYDARPATEILTNPLDKSVLNLGQTEIHARHESILDALDLKPDFALRLGETAVHEWMIGRGAMKSMLRAQRALAPRDLVPNVTHKGVDLRIGLDIARVSLTCSVSTIVVVTGDSDLIPAFKFARREGVRVFLDPMEHGVRRELKAHCDQLMQNAHIKQPQGATKKKRRRKAPGKGSHRNQ